MVGEQLQNTGLFFEFFYLKQLGGPPVVLNVQRTRKVYNLVTQWLNSLPVVKVYNLLNVVPRSTMNTNGETEN